MSGGGGEYRLLLLSFAYVRCVNFSTIFALNNALKLETLNTGNHAIYRNCFTEWAVES
jgi:hypothetical protein